ncbi:hypothetical protein D1B31_15770 [Neobacillus notoginsengisoli]|uniref:Uncharacterized protein n=1 Tax=Neobacillus notoginsengisoli TaxID=1578198 RepID=A0A417YRI2_9BACI|nr:hypothetical protein D1B31_15770 [Neobacillus notoginsengisoli]
MGEAGGRFCCFIRDPNEALEPSPASLPKNLGELNILCRLGNTVLKTPCYIEEAAELPIQRLFPYYFTLNGKNILE